MTKSKKVTFFLCLWCPTPNTIDIISSFALRCYFPVVPLTPYIETELWLCGQKPIMTHENTQSRNNDDNLSCFFSVSVPFTSADSHQLCCFFRI